jgi:hypothetical protein
MCSTGRGSSHSKQIYPQYLDCSQAAAGIHTRTVGKGPSRLKVSQICPVCIVPGGRSGLSRVAAVISDVYCVGTLLKMTHISNVRFSRTKSQIIQARSNAIAVILALTCTPQHMIKYWLLSNALFLSLPRKWFRYLFLDIYRRKRRLDPEVNGFRPLSHMFSSLSRISTTSMWKN